MQLSDFWHQKWLAQKVDALFRSSPPGTFHILIGKFSYFVIRFLLNISIVKSDNKIVKVNDKKKYDLKI